MGLCVPPAAVLTTPDTLIALRAWPCLEADCPTYERLTVAQWLVEYLATGQHDTDYAALEHRAAQMLAEERW